MGVNNVPTRNCYSYTTALSTVELRELFVVRAHSDNQEIKGRFQGWILVICAFDGLNIFKPKGFSLRDPTSISSALSIPLASTNLHSPQ